MKIAEEHFRLAEDIASDLIEALHQRWLRWVRTVGERDLNSAINIARHLSSDIAISPEDQLTHLFIVRVVTTRLDELMSLPPEEQRIVLHLASQYLAIQKPQGSCCDEEDD